MIYLTRDQVREIDRLAAERYGIPPVVLMENAAIAVANAACEMLDGNCVGEIVILCGPGNNGGDGLAVARHLHNRGADVEVMLMGEGSRYKGEAKIDYDIVRAMGLSVSAADPKVLEGMRPCLVIDALFGTGLTAAPRDPFEAVSRAAKATRAPILAVDIPSGLDCDSGAPLSPATVRAVRTVTFVAKKAGFAQESAKAYLGQVTVGDIGSPRELVQEVLGTVPA